MSGYDVIAPDDVVSYDVISPDDVVEAAPRKRLFQAPPTSTLGIASPSDQRAAETARQFVSEDIPNIAATAGARVGAGMERSIGGALQAYGERKSGLAYEREKLLASRQGRYLEKMVQADDAQRQGIADTGRALGEEGRNIGKVIDEEKPMQTRAGKIAAGTVESIGSNLPGMAATMVTGSPALGLSMMGLQQFGQTYDEARSKGLSIEDATNDAAIQGGAEVATELAPFVQLAKFMKPGQLSTKVLKHYLADVPGEHVATAVQNATGKYFGSPNTTPEQRKQAAIDYLASHEHGQDQIDTFFTTLLQSAVMGGMAKTAQMGAKAAPTVKDAVMSRLAQMRKTEVALPDTGINNPAVTVDDAIKAASDEVSGDWDSTAQGELLKRLNGAEPGPVAEQVAKRGTLDTVDPREALADPMLREIEGAQLTADPFKEYPLSRPLVSEETAPKGDIIGVEGYRQKQVEPNKPILSDENQARYDAFQSGHVLKRDALDEVTANLNDPDLAGLMADGRAQSANPPETQGKPDAQIPPVAGLSEAGDTQVSPAPPVYQQWDDTRKHQEPPVPKGMVRVYRGGGMGDNVASHGGMKGRWFSTDRETAEHFLQNEAYNGPSRLSYVDLTPEQVQEYGEDKSIDEFAGSNESAVALPPDVANGAHTLFTYAPVQEDDFNALLTAAKERQNSPPATVPAADTGSGIGVEEGAKVAAAESQYLRDGLSQSLAKTASWVVKEKATGKAIMETYDPAKVAALNTDKYEAVPILQHLQSFNNKDVTPPSPLAIKAKELGKKEAAPAAVEAAPTAPPTVDATASARAVLQQLSSPKRKSDTLVANLKLIHGKEILNHLVKQEMVRFPGQGRAEITKAGMEWLSRNPAPRTAKQQERYNLLSRKKKLSEKEQSALAQLAAMAEPATDADHASAPQLSVVDKATPAGDYGTLSIESINRVRDLIVNALPDKVDLNIVRSINYSGPGMVEAYAQHGVTGGKVNGLHQAVLTQGQVRSIITLALDGATESTGYHEVMHSARALSLIKPSDVAILERAYPTEKGVHTDERQADAFAEFVTKGAKPANSLVAAIFRRIQAFLNRLQSFMEGKGWRTAEDVFSDLMEGKLKRNAQGKVEPSAAVQFAAAWHGSPHDFDKFRSSAIGTGEGAQAYGHGLYFAGSKDVAEWYKKNLTTYTQRDIAALKQLYDDNIDKGQPFEEAHEGSYKYIPDHGKMVFAEDGFALYKDGDELYGAKRGGKVVPLGKDPAAGRLYHVELAPKENEYLLWDKPLSEQSEKVKAALAGEFANLREMYGNGRDPLKMTGAEFYKGLDGTQQEASKYLHSLGIRGIKYLDGSSRGKGEGNYNYVVFNEDDVEIKAKFSLQGQNRSDLPEETRAQKVQRTMQDRYARVGVLQKWLKEQGVNLTTMANASQRLYTLNGKIADQLKRFMDNEVEPLVKEASKAKITLTDISDYLLMQHASEANEAMRKLHDDPDATAFGVTDAEARQALAAYRARPDFADLKRLADKWQAFSGQTADLLKNNGIISQEMKDAWDNSYQHYVPVRGGEENQQTGTGKGMRVNGKQQRRSGHEKRDEFVLENIIKARERAIKTIEKNKVSLSVAQLILEADDDRIGTVGRPEKRRVFKNQKQYTVLYQGHPVASFTKESDADAWVASDRKGSNKPLSDYVVNISSDPTVSWVTSPTLGDHEINAYVNGHQLRIQINDEIAARALTNMGVEQLNSLLQVGKTINNYFARAYTGYDPRFTVRNTFRDFTAGIINLTGDYGAATAAKIALNYPKAVKEFFIARHDPTKSQWVDRYRKNGGSTGASWLSSLERVGEDLQDIFTKQNGAYATYQEVYQRQIRNGASPMKSYVKAVAASGLPKLSKYSGLSTFLKAIETMNAISENAFRVSTFMTLVEEGKSDAEAGEAAKNSTINFDKKGEIGPQMGALWLFFNPAVQGIHRTIYALAHSKHKHQAQALAGSLALVGFLLAEFGRGGDDDDKEWDKIPRHVKNRNLVLRTGEKTQLTIPIPYEYGSFVGIGYALNDLHHGKFDKRTGLNLASTIIDGFAPLGNPVTDDGDVQPLAMMPTVPKIVLAPTMNLNSFGNRIAPEKFMESKPDSQNMWRGTRGSFYDKAATTANELTGGTKYSSGAVDVSPEVLKYYTRTILGGAATFVDQVVGMGMIAGHGAEAELSEMPMVSVVARENTVRDTRRVFWEIAKDAKKAQEEYHAAKKGKDYETAKKLKEENAELIAVANIAASSAKLAKAKRDAVDAIRLDENMDFAEKREKTRLIEGQEAAIYDRLIKRFMR